MGTLNLWPKVHEWHDIVLPAVSWGEKLVRPLVVYLFLLAAFRFSGKRELGQATLFDFLIILLISNVVQNAMIGNDNSIAGAFAGVATLLTLSWALNRATSRSIKVRRALEGVPTLLVHNGHIIQTAMHKESVSRNDLLMALREQGIASLIEVRYAVLELDGKISVIRSDEPKTPGTGVDCVTAEILAQAPSHTYDTVPSSLIDTAAEGAKQQQATPQPS